MSKKIFVVEDDADLSDAIQMILHDEGYRTVASLDKNSIKGVILHMPDMVLVDYKLKDGFGSELCVAIKKHPLTYHIPVILISGYPGLGDIAKACGADAWLSKPFELTDLTRLVGHYLKRAA